MDGEAGQVRTETIDNFTSSHFSPIAVLRQCLRDPDKNVRWPAALILGRSSHTYEAVRALREAMHDEDVQVRFQAINSLGRRGANSSQAVDDLIAVMKNDPEVQVRALAERALWRIQPAAAQKARGWSHFVSSEWGFSVEMPAEPTMKDAPVETPFGPVLAHAFQSWIEPTCFQLVVTDYPKEYVESTSEDLRNEGLRQSVPFFFHGGKINWEKPMDFRGRKGVEMLIEVEPFGFLHSRHFWVGQRLYHITVIFKKEFIIPEAARYFLESFEVTSN